MPLTYDFTFSPDYAGLSATVIDSSGAEVEGSPATLDAAGQCSLSLAEGIYLAGASNTATAKNNAHTNGVLNVPASIEAGGGGGGSSTLARYQLECNNAALVNAGAIVWDTSYGAADGYDEYPGTLPDSAIDLPAGRYSVAWEIWVDAPNTARLLYGQLFASAPDVPHSYVQGGQYYIPNTVSGARIYGNGLIIVPEGADVFKLQGFEQIADTADSTHTPININYALLYLDFLGPL